MRARDFGGFVADDKTAVNSVVLLPAAYRVEYGGTYQKLQSAAQRLSIVVPVMLVMIVGLLTLALGSLREP